MKNIKENIYLVLEKLDIETDCEVSRFLNANGYPNLTCCPKCGVDDFVHVEGCEFLCYQGPDKFSEKEIGVVDKINLRNEEKYGKIKECCHMYPPFCRCEIKIKIMDEITIEELKNNNSKRVSILTYRGDGDPVRKLDNKIREYTNGEKYWEFIDMNMDNPWTRIIVFGEL